MNLIELFDLQVTERPDQTAIIDGGCGRERRFTYEELARTSAHVAEHLHRKGINSDSRVLVLVPMRAELYATLIGIWRLGATALFVDPSMSRNFITYCCTMAKPEALIGIPKARLLVGINGELRRIRHKLYWGRNLSTHPKTTPPSTLAKVSPEHPAILTFTSGSTGQPKGAIRSHGVLKAQYDALISTIDLKPGEIDMATMPVIALVNLAAGLTTFIPDVNLNKPGHINARRILKQINAIKPTRSGASPAFFLRICEEAQHQQIALPQFEKLYTGGAPVFPRSLRLYAVTFPNASINILYGSTEAEPISHISLDAISPKDLDQMRSGQGLLVGSIAAETQLRIIEDQTEHSLLHCSREKLDAMTLPAGQVGEIIVAGAHVVSGYLNGQGDAENKISLGETEVWHRTGDAGWIDDQHRLWLLGRCAEKFSADGRTLYPFAIECAAVEQLDIPIAGCLCIRGGYTLALPIQAKRNHNEFSFTPAPTHIRYLPKMPLDKRHNAKVNYVKLAKLLSER